MPYTNPNTLTLVASTILSANSHWNRVVENISSAFVTAQGSALSFAVASGILSPAANSFGTVNAASLSALSLSTPNDFTAGKVNAASFLAVRSAAVYGMVQQVSARRVEVVTYSAETFSTYLVCSITPIFSDSLLRVEGTISGRTASTGGAANNLFARYNLCLFPNSGTTVLTFSSGDGDMPCFAGAGANANTVRGSGTGGVMYVESNRPAGVPLQYGIKVAPIFLAASGSAIATYAEMYISEWR